MWTDRVGLCSVTFRALPAIDVARTATRAGLRIVEWGADVHAPPESTSDVRDLTAASGLTTSSYGSYWRAGDHDIAEFGRVVDAAVTLGAPRIRVWAGSRGSADVSSATRAGTVAALRDAAALAAARGVEVALEFHAGTLTDTPESTLALLDAVDHTGLRTYWQPPVDEPASRALAGLADLLPRVSAVHVFSWWPGHHRLALADRADLWRGVLELVSPVAPLDLLLEFVPNDDPRLLAREAATLLAWVRAAN